ncbi:hypothetical protein [Micromonospora olivasterospora]
MSTYPGQPRNQAGDGGDLGDWATWQGPDMDWQPSLAPSPAVTRTDAGTVHAGDTPHHPADESPTTAPVHPGQPQPQPTADSQWVRNPDDARTLFDQHANHIATTTQQQPEQLRQLWNAMINHMSADGIITVTESNLATATSTPQQTVHRRIVALRDRGLLQLVQKAHRGVAARYRVTDPDQPRQAPLPALPAGSRWVRNRDDARTLFNQHADIATTTRQREQLPQLWNAMINHMNADGIITVTESALATATSTPQQTVHRWIVALRDRGLLQLVQEGHRGVAARYRVTDPGQPRQAPLPGPAPEPDRPQGEDLSWLNHGDTSPMPGPVPAPPAGTGLSALPGPLDDPDAPTASSWPAGWTEPAGPDPGMGVTDGDGAAISTDPGQPSIDDQAGDGSGNLGDWATYEVGPAGSLDVDPADLLYLLEAVGTEPDPGPQPMDPPRPQAPPGPTSWSQPSGDQPSQSPGTQSFPPGPGMQEPAPQSPMPGPAPAPPADTGLPPGLPGLPGPLKDPDAPTASSWLTGPAASAWPAGWTEPAGSVPGIGVTDGHDAAMSTDPGQPSIDDQADDGSGNPGDWATHQGPDMDWQPSLEPSPAVTRTDAGTLHADGTLHHPADQPPTTLTPLHPDQPQPQPQPTADSRRVRNPNEARTLFDQHADHIATTRQREPLRQLWNALIDRIDGDGIITASVSDLAEATSTPRPTVHRRIGVLRGSDLLRLVQEGHAGGAARYEVSDPDQPQQAPMPALPAGSRWVRDPDEARTLFDQHTGHIRTRQPEQLRQLWSALVDRMDGDGIITASESALAEATSTLRQTVHDRIGVLRGSGLLRLVQEGHAGVAARYRVSDPGQPRQALMPALPAGSRWVRDPDEARRLFDQHAGHIATTTRQREQLGQLWSALVERIDGDGLITASEPDLAKATSTSQSTVHSRIGVLRGRGLLRLVQEGHAGVAARYRVSDPGQPRQALMPALPAGSRWVRDPDEARRLFDQHAGHIATTTRQREQLGQLWNALIDHMNDDGTIAASEPELAKATSTLRPTVHRRIGVLRGRGLLRLVQESHGGVAARYEVSDPGQPQQAPVPGPALGSDRPQGEDLSWLDHGDTLPMPGPAPAPPADTGLPGLLDDPDAPTASSWQAGWTEPGWPVPDSDVTAHGAAMSTDPGQPRDQAGDGGDLGDWATHQGPVMDWQPSPAVTRTDAGTLHAGDTPHHPADEPPTTAPLHPDQPQPQPTADSRRVRDRDRARTLFDQHAGHIATTTRQREQLGQLWNALIDHMNDDGVITASEPDLAKATSTPQRTVHDRIGVMRDRGLLQLVQESHGREAARYEVTDPGQPRQAPLPDLPEGSQWARDRNDARTLFDQHAGHNAPATRQRDQLRKLWNALIDSMDGDGLITVTESDLAAATSTPRRTVRDRIGALRDRGLLQLVQEANGGGAARYRVSDPGQPRQASVPGPAPEPDRPQGGEDLSWLNHGDTSPMPGPAPAPPAGTGLPGLSGPPWPLDAPDAPTASSWQAGPAASACTVGWAGPAGPVSGSGVTDGHGAAMSTDPGQPSIDDQAGDGSGNLADWATSA